MAESKKIVSETFVDEKGNVVDSAKDAARIEVTEKLPDGSLQRTYLVKPGFSPSK
jgi:hypothetical protein